MSRSNAAISKKIESIEVQLGKLKLLLVDEPKAKKPSEPKKKKDKPESIDTCKKKSELEKFTVKELKDWIKEHKIEAKKLSEKRKNDLVKFVWDVLKKSSDSESSESEESEESGSESDSGSESE
jgi:hypothetical protein